MTNTDIKLPSYEDIQNAERHAHELRAEYTRALAVSFSNYVKALFHRPEQAEHVL